MLASRSLWVNSSEGGCDRTTDWGSPGPDALIWSLGRILIGLKVITIRFAQLSHDQASIVHVQRAERYIDLDCMEMPPEQP